MVIFHGYLVDLRQPQLGDFFQWTTRGTRGIRFLDAAADGQCIVDLPWLVDLPTQKKLRKWWWWWLMMMMVMMMMIDDDWWWLMIDDDDWWLMIDDWLWLMIDDWLWLMIDDDWWGWWWWWWCHPQLAVLLSQWTVDSNSSNPDCNFMVLVIRICVICAIQSLAMLQIWWIFWDVQTFWTVTLLMTSSNNCCLHLSPLKKKPRLQGWWSTQFP